MEGTPCGTMSTRRITVSSLVHGTFGRYGRTLYSGMGPYPPQVRLTARISANWRWADGVGVSTPCGTVLTREITVFVPNLLDLYMYGRSIVPGMAPYPPRVPLAPRTPANQRSASGVGVSTPCRQVSTRGITVSSLVRRICRDGRVSNPEMDSYPP